MKRAPTVPSMSLFTAVEEVVDPADDSCRLKGRQTGAALIAAIQASPHRDLEIEPSRVPMPVREVYL